MKNILLLLLIGTTLFSCQAQQKTVQEDVKKEVKPQVVKKMRPSALNRGKFFEQDGKKMLYGGDRDSQHFDISNSDLNPEQYHYGLGRERFPALLKPEFITVAEADRHWQNDARFLVAYAGNEVKAYSVRDLTRHEIVNDVIDGQPIMAAYCILADLGAIYNRQYGETTLTFGVSGYTYYDYDVWGGLDGFLIWDRDTESLWWPLIDKAVSGPLKNVKLQLYNQTNWKDTDWKTVKERYPNAQVLRSGQDYIRPQSWNKLEDVSEIIENYSE